MSKGDQNKRVVVNDGSIEKGRNPTQPRPPAPPPASNATPNNAKDNSKN